MQQRSRRNHSSSVSAASQSSAAALGKAFTDRSTTRRSTGFTEQPTAATTTTSTTSTTTTTVSSSSSQASSSSSTPAASTTDSATASAIAGTTQTLPADDLQHSHDSAAQSSRVVVINTGSKPLPQSTSSPDPYPAPPSIKTTSEHPLTATMQSLLDLDHVPSVGGDLARNAYDHCPVEPPITPDSLAELDTARIVNNPKLRHDVNYDRELHFRPNLDGDRGKQKVRANNDYWRAVEFELCLIDTLHRKRADPAEAHREAEWRNMLQGGKKRLPKVLEAIRDVLKTLVPEADQRSILDRLDVDFLMQQIDNGVCDLVDLANWLAKVIKTHCAPMRDALVDEMQKDVELAVLTSNSLLLTESLRSIINILEAMKLDVANHQIRHIRPILINDTINFQQRYNAHRIELGKIDVGAAQIWLQHEEDRLVITSDFTPAPVDALTSALLRDLLYSPPASAFPPTFYLDNDRLKTLRAEMHNYIYAHICHDLLYRLDPSASAADFARAKSTLQSYIVAIVGPQGRFAENVENIAVQITRILLTLQNRQEVCDSTLTSLVETALRENLRPASAAFCEHAKQLYDRLLPKLQSSIHKHSKKTPLELQEALVPSPLPTSTPHANGFGAVLEPVRNAVASDPDSSIIRRLTHVITLHWHIWADLVYLAPSKDTTDGGADMQRPPTPATPSTTPIPTDQAAYPERCKFIPIATDPHSGRSITGMPTPASSPAPDNNRTEGNSEPSESAPGSHSSVSPD